MVASEKGAWSIGHSVLSRYDQRCGWTIAETCLGKDLTFVAYLNHFPGRASYLEIRLISVLGAFACCWNLASYSLWFVLIQLCMVDK